MGGEAAPPKDILSTLLSTCHSVYYHPFKSHKYTHTPLLPQLHRARVFLLLGPLVSVPIGLLALPALGRLLALSRRLWLPPFGAAARALTPRAEVGVGIGAVGGRGQARPELGVDAQHL